MRRKFLDIELIELHQEGYYDNKIAEELGVSSTYVRLRRIKLGLKSNYGFTDEAFLYWYNRGLNDTEIAERLGVSSSSISRRIKKIGLKSNFSYQSKEWRKQRRESLKKIRIPKDHTTQELQFLEICKKFNLLFRYVGDNKIQIPEDSQFPYKNPDFIHNNGTKLVIEIFGSDYYHNPLKKQGLPYHKTYQGTIEHYKKHGYKCIIFWGNELKNEELVLERLHRVGGIV